MRAAEYPQAIAVYMKDGTRIPLDEVDQSQFTIHVDWVIERQLIDDNIVAFKSTTTLSLRTNSMQTRRANIIESESLQLPEVLVSPNTFNADFDGYSFNSR